jgi:hypothetical protein
MNKPVVTGLDVIVVATLAMMCDSSLPELTWWTVSSEGVLVATSLRPRSYGRDRRSGQW